MARSVVGGVGRVRDKERFCEMAGVQARVHALEQARFELRALTANSRFMWISRSLLFVGCELDLKDCTSVAECARYFLSGYPSTVGSGGTVLSLLARF